MGHHVGEGRFGLNIVVGWNEDEFQMFGVTQREHEARYEFGQEWLDAYGGHAVASTGHCHPHVVAAIQRQAAALIFYSTAVPLRLRDWLP